MKLLASFLAALFISASVWAAPLSGTYTIGGINPGYANFTAAANALAANGVSGPVTFNVRTGVYTEQVVMTAITGASVTNTITFQSETGNAADVTWQYPTANPNNYVLKLDGAGYITLNKMTFATSTIYADYGTILNLVNRGDNITISNNIFNGLVTTAFTSTHVLFIVNFFGSNLCVHDNVVNGGSIGICLAGADNAGSVMTNASIRHNKVNNFYGWGISANYVKNSVIEDNEITTATNSTYGVISIYLQNNSYPVSVLKNKILTTGTGNCTGMYIVNNHPTGLANGMLIANNTISTNNAYSLYLINNEYSRFYNNSVYNGVGGAGFVVYGNSKGNQVANNIFYQAGNGFAMDIDTTAVSYCNYNNIYAASANFGTLNNTNYTSLAAWKAGYIYDANSISAIPPYVSTTDLHLSSFASMRLGTPLTLTDVPDDMDFNLRGATPTLGADDSGSVVVNIPSCCGCSAPNFTADKTSICKGGIIHFTDETGFTTTGWKWTFSGGTPGSSLTQNPTVTYDTVGAYDVKLVVTTGNGTDSVLKTGYITVTPGPDKGTVSAEPDTLCAGEAAQLTVTGSAGSIQWQSLVQGSFTDINGEVNPVLNTPLLTQSATYRWVVTSGACSDTSQAISLQVNPVPAPSISIADTLICSSDSSLVSTGSGYAAYVWSNGDTRNYTYAGSAGAYWVTVTDGNGCSAVTNHVQLAVYPVPSVSIIVQGDTLASFGAAAYQWLLNDTVIEGATANMYIAKRTGYYSVQITDNNGCTTTSSPVYVGLVNVDNVFNATSITVFPNPFNQTIYIQNPNETERIEIYDLPGRRLINKQVNNGLVNPYIIDVNLLPQGMYYLRVVTPYGDYIKRITKQ